MSSQDETRATDRIAFLAFTAFLEALRPLIRAEIDAAAQERPAAAPTTKWLTPPAAARELGLPVRTVRALVRARRVTPRVRNSSSSPKQRKFLVNVDEVAAVVSVWNGGAARPESAPSLDLAARAERLRMKAWER